MSERHLESHVISFAIWTCARSLAPSHSFFHGSLLPYLATDLFFWLSDLALAMGLTEGELI